MSRTRGRTWIRSIHRPASFPVVPVERVRFERVDAKRVEQRVRRELSKDSQRVIVRQRPRRHRGQRLLRELDVLLGIATIRR